jgi:hypothetical protein
VVEARGDARLAPQPRAGALVGGVATDHFERDVAMQTLVDGTVDDTHAAFADRTRDAVASEHESRVLVDVGGSEGAGLARVGRRIVRRSGRS